jgi:hypothetical protein
MNQWALNPIEPLFFLLNHLHSSRWIFIFILKMKNSIIFNVYKLSK